MKYEWDHAKNLINTQKHGCDFQDAVELLEGDKLVFPDDRQDYGEVRFIAMGFICNRVMVAVYTERSPGITRVISLRKANNREKEKFERTIEDGMGKG